MTLTLSIVSPEKKITETECQQVTVPTAMGEITVLPEHAPLFSVLSPGEILVRESDKQTRSIVVSGGFLSVHKNKVIVLADFGIPTEEIDEKKILDAKARAEEAMKEKKSDEAFALAEGELYKALLQLKVAQKKKTVH